MGSKFLFVEMLRRLTVSNLAIVERAEVEFGPGLNVITGETGAGKSVLMGALGIAKVPYDIWFKWWWKILLCFMLLGLAFLLVTVMVPLNGF